jgi:bile acid:Na+ symporter, BASS family
MLERYLLAWLSLLSLLAFSWTRWAAWDPFVASQPLLNPLFALVMFAIGWLLPAGELSQLAGRWPAVLAGTAVQYASMPTLAYVIGRALRLPANDMWGIMLAGSVPGAMASNVLTLLARGNVSYSVCLTTLATLLSPLAVPLALWLSLGRSVDFPAVAVSWQLCWMVVLPVVAGHLLARRFDRLAVAARRIGGSVANLAILWIIAVVVALNRERLGNLTLILPVALLALNVCGYGAGYLAAGAIGLPDTMRRALTLEIGMQNAGLGTVLALSVFGTGERAAVAVAPALYTFGCMFTGTVLASWWGRRGTEDRGDRPRSR